MPKLEKRAISIELQGVSTNNLKGIDVSFPLGRISVVTGVSGSGKSSLVFDTLYGEAYRRYVESLSSFARQYLKSLPKPKLTDVRNLPPAIAVQQTRSGATNRSTVGTMTELNDILRILFTHLSEIYSSSGHKVERDTPDSVSRKVMERFDGQRVLVLAPLARWDRLSVDELKRQLEAQGFSRLRSRGTVVRISEAGAFSLGDTAVVVDRIKVGADSRVRLAEAAGLAFKVGRGYLTIQTEARDEISYSTQLECLETGESFSEPSPALLSFNHPLGACSNCQGFGYASSIDWDKVIPNRQSCLAEKGVLPWNFGKFKEYYSWAATSLKRTRGEAEAALALDQPFAAYSKDQWEWLLHGDGGEFDGIVGYFEYLERKKYKAHYRIHAARFRKYELCPGCHGDRLSPEALACRILGKNIAEVSKGTIDETMSWLQELRDQVRAAGPGLGQESGMMGVDEALEEASARLGYLQKIGVGYLSLARSARSLSGGELQRINMARCLGSALTETLFCLDEPTSGLHARDSVNLLQVIRELRDQGNTVVMVEHERALIRGADHLVEIGPKAGHEGGELVYEGAPSESRLCTASFERVLTRRPLPAATSFIKLEGARTHNLKGIDVRIPVGAMTGVCGVSGSGKTSLIQHTLYPMLAQRLGQPVEKAFATTPDADGVGPDHVIARHGAALLVSQAALGRSNRSNIATYLGIMDEIRKLLAAQPTARTLGLTPGSFSFNTAGGRCETCKGLGTVVEDLSFLGEMDVICPDCHGKRFGDHVLQVDIRGRNLNDILSLTVAEAREFFYDRPVVVRICDVILEMGMGYVTLGQSTSSFSGGEAQRLKLISLMKEVKVTRPSILIFDEPTTGLSDRDVANLLRQLRGLTEKGHTVIVVEHHLGVLCEVDWLIEVGPEAAREGGNLVYQGTLQGITQAAGSITAAYLKEYDEIRDARKATPGGRPLRTAKTP